MKKFDLLDNFPGAITICDINGIILEMNEKAKETFKKSGGEKLIGSNLFDCHTGSSNEKLKNFMEAKKVNSYTIEKNGIKRLIYQTPLFENWELKGFAELSLEIPFDMPHFVRK